MDATRRSFLKISLSGLAVGIIAPALASCSSGGGSSSPAGTLAFWIWADGLSTKVLDSVNAQFPEYPINVSVVGGDFKQKLVTSFTARSGLPDITGVKGEDMPYFLAQADLFTDLNTLGADKLKGDYLDWKWAQGTSQDGKLVGFPIDIGPTAMYYRQDVFADAGLPSTPEELATANATWESFFDLGSQLKAAKPDHHLLINITEPMSKGMGQSAVQFIDKDGKLVADQDHVKQAWDRSVSAYQLGLTAGVTDGTPDWAAGITSGTLPCLLGAAWLKPDIVNAATSTSGLWRVAATPGGPANIGGSFLTIPAASEQAQEAFDVIAWLLSAQNQAAAFADKNIFPSTPASYAMPELTQGDEFFGGQKTIEIFGPAAQDIPIAYASPNDNIIAAPFYTELTNIEATGKDPDQAWKDAVAAAKQAFKQL